MTEGQRPETWEQRLVYHADRIARGPRLVTIEERIADMRRRRPGLLGQLALYQEAALAQEASIAVRLRFTSAELRCNWNARWVARRPEVCAQAPLPRVFAVPFLMEVSL